ncbi:MAG: hypothetical protein ACRDVG_00465 [Jatrophihabitantaceae bacterium]
MGIGRAAAALRRTIDPKVVGGLGAVTIAAVVYSQFNLYGLLGRDAAIYVYGGQRFTHGVPPFASIMDPKGPISGILCGFGVAIARLAGHNDVLVIRAEFCAMSILAVLGIYLLVLEMWHSAIAGVVAAAVFTSFKMFAYDALGGPDGHTPGIVFVIFALWLTVRRSWYWAGVAASLAFFSWQPLFFYPVIAFVCAIVWSPERRRRAAGWSLAGLATPFVVLIVYYAAEGYIYNLFEGTFIFPLVGGYRPPVGFGDRLDWIFSNIPASYGSSAVLLWIGLLLLLAVAVWTVVSASENRRAALTGPIVLLLLVSLLVQVAYVLYDYIGWTHAFPLLPYAAVGFGGAVALLLQKVPSPQARRATTATLVAAVTALTVVCSIQYYQPSDDSNLRGELASACALQRSLAPRTTLWVIDQPTPLVLLHRRNPDNYAFVGGGLAEWRVKHVRGGFAGWVLQIKARASIVVLDSWRETIPIKQQLEYWLTAHYYRGFIGRWPVWVSRTARATMAAHSIRLTHERHDWPLKTAGGTFRRTSCPRAPAGS